MKGVLRNSLYLPLQVDDTLEVRFDPMWVDKGTEVIVLGYSDNQYTIYVAFWDGATVVHKSEVSITEHNPS
ncbi:hypothetical protein D3C76_1672160 [compost metagenome]